MKLKRIADFLDEHSDKRIYVNGKFRMVYLGTSSNYWLIKERGNNVIEKIEAGSWLNGEPCINIYVRCKE